MKKSRVFVSASRFFAWVFLSALLSKVTCFKTAASKFVFICKINALRYSEVTKLLALIEIV